MKTPRYATIKKRETRRRLAAIASRGTSSAAAYQRRASLVGDGAKWKITNFRQVAAAMAKWA